MEPLQERKEKFLESLSSDALLNFHNKLFSNRDWQRETETRDILLWDYATIEDCIFARHLHKLYLKALLRESIDWWVEINEGEVSLCEVEE